MSQVLYLVSGDQAAGHCRPAGQSQVCQCRLTPSRALMTSGQGRMSSKSQVGNPGTGEAAGHPRGPCHRGGKIISLCPLASQLGLAQPSIPKGRLTREKVTFIVMCTSCAEGARPGTRMGLWRGLHLGLSTVPAEDGVKGGGRLAWVLTRKSKAHSPSVSVSLVSGVFCGVGGHFCKHMSCF